MPASIPIDLNDTIGRIERFFTRMHEAGAVPLSAGGDHLITLPIMRAIAKDRPVGLIHFDAHSDTWDSYFGGYKITHGTLFRRAVEEGLLDPKRTIQIGIRGSVYDLHDMDFANDSGMARRHHRGIFRHRLGEGDRPRPAPSWATALTYISFDVDGLDPVYAPGTGTPEIGGFSTHEAQRMLRWHARPQFGRRRRGGGGAALRPQRQHRPGGRHHDVRDPMCAGGGGGRPQGAEEGGDDGPRRLHAPARSRSAKRRWRRARAATAPRSS